MSEVCRGGLIFDSYSIVFVSRSQGTLSDLLRNPKPWNKLKSGRETFRRMFNWVQQPLELRLGILDMYKGTLFMFRR
uniref:CUT domain-containing protein n=1 Tax=Parascaris equorum TaxID=6256 RepID=A0A914RZ74_PAREQ